MADAALTLTVVIYFFFVSIMKSCLYSTVFYMAVMQSG